MHRMRTICAGICIRKSSSCVRFAIHPSSMSIPSPPRYRSIRMAGQTPGSVALNLWWFAMGLAMPCSISTALKPNGLKMSAVTQMLKMSTRSHEFFHGLAGGLQAVGDTAELLPHRLHLGNNRKCPKDCAPRFYSSGCSFGSRVSFALFLYLSQHRQVCFDAGCWKLSAGS